MSRPEGGFYVVQEQHRRNAQPDGDVDRRNEEITHHEIHSAIAYGAGDGIAHLPRAVPSDGVGQPRRQVAKQSRIVGRRPLHGRKERNSDEIVAIVTRSYPCIWCGGAVGKRQVSHVSALTQAA